jgi:hypothetical protein
VQLQSVPQVADLNVRLRIKPIVVRLALWGAIISASALAGVSTVQAASPSGTAVSVIPAAAANGAEGRRILKVDGDVFMGDKVQTGPGGEAQIEFKDATRLVVGPNSLMTIDAFVFNADNTARKITVNAAKGAFRFITGNSEKQAYTIKTPTATIGVRGTQFDFSVAGNGEMTLALFEGQARVCDLAGVCRDVRGSCAVVVAPPSGGVDPATWNQPVAARFPYVASQASLLPRFRVNTTSCADREASVNVNRNSTTDGTRTNSRTSTSRPAPDPSPPDDHCGDEGEGSQTYDTSSRLGARAMSTTAKSLGGGLGSGFGGRSLGGSSKGSGKSGAGTSGRSSGSNGRSKD